MPPPNPPADSLVPAHAPANIAEYAFLGCFGSTTGFRTFTPRASDTDMTLEKCVALCDPDTYAGVRGSECFCADDLDPDTRAEADRERCDIPCPGNSTQFCGGSTNTTPVPSRLLHLHRRAAPANYLLTVYGHSTGEAPPPAPPLGDAEPHVPTTSTLVTTVTYTTVYATDAASLVPAEHVTTIMVPGCDKYCDDRQPRLVNVPMSTTVAQCNGCGPNGENEVTLTVPLQIAAMPRTTGYWPTGGPMPPQHSPTAVSINSAAGLRLGWHICVGVATATFEFVLMLT